MFGFLKKRGATRQTERTKLIEAEERGRDSARSMTADIDAFLEENARPLARAIFSAFELQIHNIDLSDTDITPFAALRSRSTEYLEQVDGVKVIMREQCIAYAKGWIAHSVVLNAPGTVELYIDHQLNLLGLEMVGWATEEGAPVMQAFLAAGSPPLDR